MAGPSAIPLFYGTGGGTILDGMPDGRAPGTGRRHAPVTYDACTRWFSDRTYWRDDRPTP